MDQETPVHIYVKSVIREGSDTETIEFRTTGFYYMKKIKYIFLIMKSMMLER